MKILVTGSSGFIGQALVRRLRTEGCAVVGLDKVRAATTDIDCDILDADRLKAAVQNVAPDALVHLAARIDLDEKTNLAGYAANIEGVENLVEAVRLTPSIRRGIWTSSQLVCRVGYVPKSDTDYTADTLYGKSKVRTEQIVRSANGGGREWCLARPTTVWGPGMSAHYQRFLRSPIARSTTSRSSTGACSRCLPNRSRAERSILPTTHRSTSSPGATPSSARSGLAPFRICQLPLRAHWRSAVTP